jgi:hypothetical protein
MQAPDRVDSLALAWCLLNVFQWPPDWGPSPPLVETAHGRCNGPRARAAMRRIERKIGMAACLKAWNDRRFYAPSQRITNARGRATTPRATRSST